MTPTIEEVNRVAEECGAVYFPSSEGYDAVLEFTSEELQTFAQHWIEVGEKKRRDNVTKSAKDVECTFHHMCPTRDCNLMCEDRIISNNTGE